VDYKPDRIDFQSPVPYYAQLVQLLKEKMNRGSWKVGEKIPGEQELCTQYGVSRTVVRQALGELEILGTVRRQKGKGAFVAEPKINESLVQKLTGFYQDMVERGFEPMTLVLRQRVIPANDLIASYLQIQPGTEVVDLLRLRFINDEPIQLVNSFIPYDLCPGAAEVDFSQRSLYEYFEKDCQLEISRGRRYIEAVSADKETARWLRVKNGAALIQLDSVSYLDNGQPVEYYRAFHRGDRSRFEVELVRSRRGQDEYLAGTAGYPGSSDFYKNRKD
jgi:GntR family transcriptional regulator